MNYKKHRRRQEGIFKYYVKLCKKLNYEKLRMKLKSYESGKAILKEVYSQGAYIKSQMEAGERAQELGACTVIAEDSNAVMQLLSPTRTVSQPPEIPAP